MLWIWMIGWGLSLGFCEPKESQNKWLVILDYLFCWPLNLGTELRRLTKQFLRKNNG